MNKFISLLILGLIVTNNSFAASWTKLQDNKHATLMLDRQTIAESGKYQKAWVKIRYKTVQQNLEYADKSYNNAKLLWYFNCAEQKSASIQVYQLLDDEQVFSAAIDVKRARFIEPVPETEIDLAMHYVCKKKAAKQAAMVKKEAVKEKVLNGDKQKGDKKTSDAKEKKKPEVVAAEKEVPEEPKVAEAKEPKEKPEKANKEKKRSRRDKAKAAKESRKKLSKNKKDKKRKKTKWTYKGKSGPEFWGDLTPDYMSCKAGWNQSPIDIDKTITAQTKPIKAFQRFPAKEILNNGHTVQANFKSGNVLALDGVMYQMKQVHFHAPSENTIKGQFFPLEAHFVHTDPKGNLAVLAVMFEEGAENKGLKKLWKQMPKKKGRPKKLKAKILPGELMPLKKGYYRFSGSLTTPPCTEGVVWLVRKTTMTASKSQIDALKKAIRHDNSRPVQPLNGRLVVSQ